MSETKRIAERVTPFVGARVDRKAGVIREAMICGLSSENGRDYLPSAFKDGKQYEGRQSFLNHSDGRRGRRTEDLIGWWSDVKVRPDGRPSGTFNVVKSHPHAEMVFEVAERNPSLLGFSHVADCKFRRGTSGREVVEEVREVESIDLVAQPATTKGIFEGKAVTLKEYIDKLAPRLGIKRIGPARKLAEMDGMADVPMDDAPPAEEADPDEAVSAAFEAAIMSVVKKAMSGDLDPAAAVKKIKSLIASHGEHADDGAGASGGGEGGGDDDDSAAVEGKRKKADPWTVVEDCSAEGYTATPAELKLLAHLPTSDERRKYIREQKARVPGETIKAAGRHAAAGAGSGTRSEGRTEQPIVWQD